MFQTSSLNGEVNGFGEEPLDEFSDHLCLQMCVDLI